MVKVGFIVEGDTEKVLVSSLPFKNWISQFNIEIIDHIINAKGGGNLLPHKINDMIETLNNKGADHIFILTDLEDYPSISHVKERISHPQIKDSFITIVATESWFLACSTALGFWLEKDTQYYVEDPESKGIEKPFERIKALGLQEKKRGCRNKITLAKDMVQRCGFSFEEILAHPNCSSIKYIESILKTLHP
ncbi:hypothetical protein ACFQ4S_14455 [Acinetobacter terrae]|uniref:hypothetical protein n=1 Tax=Acinetobacter terrae TaxID=2731247 RepID=UPI001F3A6973|nr:hypothetical protein [Acinetobacter terrae]